MTTLYKKDSKNKIRIWKIESQGSKIIQYSGLIDGKLIINEKSCKSKNVGKSNETTPEEQAKLEIISEIKSKIDEGYFYSLEEATNNKVILPMLAKSYEDEKHKIDWSSSYIQPKLDGMRCLANIKSDGTVTLISRDGKIISNMDHIIKDLSTIKKDIILDGELYAHGLSFQENMKLIKKYRKNETEKIKYHVYDLVSDDPFFNRKIKSYIKNLKNCVEVLTYPIINESDIKEYHSKFISEGYEGSIIRHGSEGYKINGRSSNLLKYKDFHDITAKIIDIEPAEQRPEWGVPVLEYNNNIFRAGMKYSHDERKEFLTNKNNYIGKTAEIRFFEYTDDGIPRFPVMVGIRLDK
jgi:DNA ligase-1